MELVQKIPKIKIIGFWVGLAAFFFIIFFIDLDPKKPEMTNMLAVALLMAIWWVFEVVPLAITALLPVVLYPLLGIMSGKVVSSVYINHIIFLFLGGFMVALAMQRWNLHKRIALRILLVTGTKPVSILFGFMFATAFLSMWISNTATTMMMLPILLSVGNKLNEYIGEEKTDKFITGLLLSVAYSASIGGVATLVGTPPNPMFTKIFQIMFPQGPDIGFTSWFIFALPISIVLFLTTWLLLYLMYARHLKHVKIDKSTFKQQYKELGKASYEEKIVLVDFILMALAWLTRSPIHLGNVTIPGWSQLFHHPEYFNDGTVAILFAIPLYIIPTKDHHSRFIMNWEYSKQLPWSIVLLFGGGFALASGFKESGLSLWFGDQLAGLGHVSPIMLILSIALLMTFLTELTSNTATTQIILPIIASLSVSIHINPLLLMLPATLSASMAFMLPVATPPNAIVFGANKLTVIQMAKTGIILNLVGAAVITLMTYYYGTVIFHIELNSFPAWATTVK
jgi:sodium-dependent dicarboxylate transporter 2/3/5